MAEHPPTTFEFNPAGDALRRLSSQAPAVVADSKPSVASNDFELVHLHEIRASIVDKYLMPAFAASAPAAMPVIDDAMLSQVIHDWIVLWFLVGNDFLPHLPSVTLDDHGTKKEFEGILKWHIESLRSDSRLTTGDTLNLPGLLSLFERLAQDEAATFQRYHKKHHSMMRFGDPTIPATQEDRVRLHEEGYSKRFRQEAIFIACTANLCSQMCGRYWTQKFGQCDAGFKATVCQQFINGFDWVLKCVFQRCQSPD